MPGANVAVVPPAAPAPAAPTAAPRKASLVPEKKYKCQFCYRAFSRSEHRSRHERSHTKERPFKCAKCRSTFVRRDLLLRHDRTVHAKDGGEPLHSDGKRRGGPKPRASSGPSKANIPIDTSALSEQLEATSEGVLDVETAAMLVADLQHHHTANMRASDSSMYDSSSMTFPQDSSMMDHSVTYSPSGVPVSQWDSFVSQPETKSLSSIGAGVSAPFGTHTQHAQQQFQHMNGQNMNGLVPALQSMIGSAPPSAVSTPAAVSSYAVQTSGEHTGSVPKAPQVASDAERNVILDSIRANDTDHSIPEGFRLPGLGALNRYLATYFGLFHHHLPFLHPASFDPIKAPPALLLSVLSIGALYAFDQEQAYMAHIGSKVLVNQFLQNREAFSSRKCPLWTMQSSLLNLIFASWSGDPKGLEWACSIKSLLANMVAGNRYELKLRQEGREGRSPTRAEWVEDEGCRRTYYAVYIFFGLLTLTYNHTPAISFSEFGELQLPSTEALWNLNVSDEAAWQEQLKLSPSVTFIRAHENLFQGETLKYSAFATRIMINALFLEVWYHVRCPEALQDVVTEYKLRLALETWEKSLDLCEPEPVAVLLSSPHKGHPLIFNAKAMFRNARARLEVDLKDIQEALRYHDAYEVAGAMAAARDKVKRSTEMIKVIEECYNCLETAVLQGTRWVARTLPTNWSIEHPLCGLDLMIILSLWLYRLEHDDEPASPEEAAMYSKVRQLLVKDHGDPCATPDLSAAVAHLWASMLDEVVVWGITRLMGHAFRCHSSALVGYVEDIAASSNVSTPSMTSQGADEDSVY